MIKVKHATFVPPQYERLDHLVIGYESLTGFSWLIAACDSLFAAKKIALANVDDATRNSVYVYGYIVGEDRWIKLGRASFGGDGEPYWTDEKRKS